MDAVTFVVEPREAHTSSSDGGRTVSFSEMMGYRSFATAVSQALGTEVLLREDAFSDCDTGAGWVLADLGRTSVDQAVAADASLAGRLVLVGADRQTMRDAVVRLGLAGAVGAGIYRNWRTGMPFMFGDGLLAQADRAQAAGLETSRAMGAPGCVWLEGDALPELLARYLRA